MIKHTKSYIQGHPRPTFVRDQFQLLDGTWAFKFDDARAGEKEQWFLGLEQTIPILVPYAYQTKLSGIGETKQHEVVWYEVQFDAAYSEVIMLHFDGSDYLTKVWLNGIYLGVNEGGYHRFSFEISQSIKQKNNRLVVRAEDTFDTRQPRGKQRWKSENFGCWYVETTGIWRSVWLEFMHETHLENANIESNLDQQSIRISSTVNRIEEGLKLKIIIMQNEVMIGSVTQEIFKITQQLVFSFKTEDDQFKIKTWTSDHPHLYDVVYELYIYDQLVDVVKSYFAVRKWETIGQGIYLNSEPVYLKMLLDQGYWNDGGLTPSDELSWIHDIESTKKMGYNGIRKHQKIEDERFYYYCDILGVYVWLEMPSAYEFDSVMMRRITNQWIQIVEQYKQYPSIMTYVLMNESWGVQSIKHCKEQQEFTVGLYWLTKALDSTRFVISNDGWEHTKSDLVTIHDYTETKEEFEKTYRHVKDILYNQYFIGNKVKYVFANGYQYQGEPVLISEYGGIALKGADGWGYGEKVDSIEDYLTRLCGLTDAIKAIPKVSGYCLTQTTDVEQETNGVLDHTHQPKTNLKNILEINEKR